MLKHVSHRSTTSIGGVQNSSRRASVPARPYSRQPSEGSASAASTPASGRRATHSPDMIASCASTPGVHRRAKQSPEMLRHSNRNTGSPDFSRRPDLRAAYRRYKDEPPPKLGRSMSTPAGCRYPPAISPIPACVSDSSRGFNDKRIASDENVAPALKNYSFDEGEEIPNVPRSSTLPRRPMPLTCVSPPPLTSAMSYSALPPGGRTSLSGRSSSTSSLSDTIVGLPGCSGSKTAVRIHLRQLRPDIEYKTIRMDSTTTCRQLIEHLLQKLRLKHRDPNLFAVVLEVAVKGPAGAPPVKRRLVLEDSARPVELQQCRPRGEANFSVTMRRGGVLRVRDSVLTPGSQYKSLLVSYTSSAAEVVRLLLNCNNRPDDCRLFTLHESCAEPYHDRPLDSEESPLQIQASWPKERRDKYSFVLRRSLTQGLIEKRQLWRVTSVEASSTDTESEMDDQLPMPAIRLTSSIYKNPSSFIHSPKLVQKPNLMVTPCMSSNRSSISSTCSSSSSSSNPGCTGNNYFTPQNSSRVSCDSGFSSVASSPQPQTPPLRGLPHSPSSTPTLFRANEKYESKPGFSKPTLNAKEDANTNKKEADNREAKCTSFEEPNVTSLSSNETNEKKKVPPPPPRKFLRNSNIYSQRTSKNELTQEEKEDLSSKDSGSRNSNSNLSSGTEENSWNHTQKFTSEVSKEIRSTIEVGDQNQPPTEEIKNSASPLNLARTPSRPPPVTNRPTHLTTSKSTPIIREIIYKQVQSPSASSQYNTSSASSPVSQVSYVSLVSDATTPSPTASSLNKYSERHRSVSSTPTPTPSEGHSAISETDVNEPQVETQNLSNSSTELYVVTSKSSKLISSQKLELPVPPAVPPRMHTSAKSVKELNSILRTVKSTGVGKLNCIAPLTVNEDQSSQLDMKYENSEAKAAKQSNSACNLNLTFPSTSSPSPPPPPLPISSPPPMIPKEARNFYFLPNINTTTKLRRSSFPSISTQSKEDAVECHSDPSSNVEISVRCESSEIKISKNSLQNYFNIGEDYVSNQTPPQTCNRASNTRQPCASSPALYTSPYALQAQKELQQAIDSLKHLTTHDLIYI
ncbi:Ras-associating (RA) domain [Trinorchestia longiramus]|nr:Ras-associating (RA) domain [Trinorchestia longiramus]